MYSTKFVGNNTDKMYFANPKYIECTCMIRNSIYMINGKLILIVRWMRCALFAIVTLGISVARFQKTVE